MSEKEPKMMVKGMDEQGKPIMVTPEVWRDEVLPDLIQKSWDDPNMMYGVIALATDNGFSEQVLEAAQHSLETDPIRERASTMYGIVLIRSNQAEKSRDFLLEELKEQTTSAMLYSVLGRAKLTLGDIDGNKEALEKALDLDPNNEMALSWFEQALQGGEGAEAVVQMLQNVCEKDGSWRAQTWLAHRAIEAKDKATAVDYYEEAIEKSGTGVEAMTLAAIDLLTAGHVIEMIEMISDRYEPETHGADVGFCLVQGYLKTGQKARGILALNQVEGIRPELGEQIMAIRKELAKLPAEE